MCPLFRVFWRNFRGEEKVCVCVCVWGGGARELENKNSTLLISVVRVLGWW